jgi:D-hexose-6-phosphate mutarotase
MKKTKHEKAVGKVAKLVLSAVDDETGDYIKSLVDVPAVMAFRLLAERLRAARESYEKDFKKFCKTNGFTQYKIKDIEEGDIKNLDREVFRKYVNLLNMQTAVDKWIKSYPNIARKYNIP